MSEGEEFAVRSNCFKCRSVFRFVRNVRDCWVSGVDGVGKNEEDVDCCNSGEDEDVPSSECCNRPLPNKLDDVWNGVLLLIDVLPWWFAEVLLPKYLKVVDVVDGVVVENASWRDDDNELLLNIEIDETADDNWWRNLRCSRASLNRVKSYHNVLICLL